MLTHFLRDRGRRRLLDQLLMTALNRAFAFAEGNDAAGGIAEDLDLDVTWALEVLFDIDVRRSESALRFAACGIERPLQVRFRGADTHSTAATARRGLQDDGIPDLSRNIRRLAECLHRTVASRQDGNAGHLRHDARPARGGRDDDARRDIASVRAHAVHAPVRDVEAGHLGVLVDLDTGAAHLLRVAPDDSVVPDDPAGRVVERTEDRPGDALVRDVDLRAELLHLLRVDHVAVDAEQLVDLRPLLLHDERPVRVREREVPMLREHEVEVQVLRELLVELDALLVEGSALGGAVVGPDDRRVPARGPGADIALLENRDVVDAVVRRQVVRGREPVRAAADDDNVVVALQLARLREDLPLEKDVLHSASTPIGPPPSGTARSTATSHR